MAVIRMTGVVKASQSRCFDLSRSIDLHQASMARSGERTIAGVTSGLIGHDQEVTWEARHFGIRWRMTSRIIEFEPPDRFVDEMVRGPFSMYRHEHRFEPIPEGIRMEDLVEYKTPLGPLRPLADRIAGAYLRRLLRTRNQAIRAAAEGGAPERSFVSE